MMKTRGLVLDSRRYRGETTPPDTLEDTSRFENNGVHTDITWVRLPSGLWVRSFNGTSSFVSIATAPSIDLTGPFTMMMWLNFNSWAAAMTYYNRGADNTDGLRILGGGTTYIIFRTSQAAVLQQTYVDASAPTIGIWYHYAVTRDGVTARLYDAGVDVTTNPGAHIDPLTNNRIGYLGQLEGGGERLDGYMAFPKIYNYALSAAEIYSRFQAERSLFGV